MLLLESQGVFYMEHVSYAESRYPRLAGFMYDRIKRGHWATKHHAVAVRLIQFASEDARVQLRPYLHWSKLSFNASSSVGSSECSIPCPDGLDYMDFQKSSIEYIGKVFSGGNEKSVLLADDMGVGKTIQAIGGINSDDSIKRILIICPASLKINWRDELNKWLVIKRDIKIVYSNKPDFSSNGISIINYDILDTLIKKITENKYDLIIADESHYIKNKETKRAKALLKIEADRKLFLTGTPIVNRPIELWTTLNYLFPNSWHDYHWFTTTFCKAERGKYGFNVSGASNLGILHSLLRKTGTIRRLKSQVLPQLPKKTHQIIEIPCDNPDLIDEENTAYGKWIDACREVERLSALSEELRSDEYRERLARLRQIVFYHFTELSKARKRVAINKIPAIIEHLKIFTVKKEKVVVFLHHRVVGNAIEEAFGGICVKINGSIKLDDRNIAVNRFNNEDDCCVMIASIKAAGVGLTMTSACRVVFVEMMWTPADMNQAADRCHRIGQNNPVLVQYITVAGSIDAMLANKIAEKEDVIEEALDKGRDMESCDVTVIK